MKATSNKSILVCDMEHEIYQQSSGSYCGGVSGLEIYW